MKATLLLATLVFAGLSYASDITSSATLTGYYHVGGFENGPFIAACSGNPCNGTISGTPESQGFIPTASVSGSVTQVTGDPGIYIPGLGFGIFPDSGTLISGTLEASQSFFHSSQGKGNFAPELDASGTITLPQSSGDWLVLYHSDPETEVSRYEGTGAFFVINGYQPDTTINFGSGPNTLTWQALAETYEGNEFSNELFAVAIANTAADTPEPPSFVLVILSLLAASMVRWRITKCIS